MHARSKIGRVCDHIAIHMSTINYSFQPAPIPQRMCKHGTHEQLAMCTYQIPTAFFIHVEYIESRYAHTSPRVHERARQLHKLSIAVVSPFRKRPMVDTGTVVS